MVGRNSLSFILHYIPHSESVEIFSILYQPHKTTHAKLYRRILLNNLLIFFFYHTLFVQLIEK